MDKVSKYLKENWINFLIAVITSAIVSSSFLVYLNFIGIPMTNARNLENRADNARDPDGKVILYELSLEAWHTDRVAEKLENLQQDN